MHSRETFYKKYAFLMFICFRSLIDESKVFIFFLHLGHHSLSEKKNLYQRLHTRNSQENKGKLIKPGQGLVQFKKISIIAVIFLFCREEELLGGR